MTNIGSRSINQDACFSGDPLFIVADGVGGAPYGDVASKLVCSSLAEYFQQNQVTLYTEEYLNKALQCAVKRFLETESKYPETKGMATTVVLLAFDSAGASVAWLGDSRLYHIRSGDILYATEDHSLINQLLNKGEAVTGISRHRITKCVRSINTDSFSFHRIPQSQIQTGDFFFLCTDGVLENITDEMLRTELNTKDSLDQKAQKIFTLCEGKTRDNFTFQIIQI